MRPTILTSSQALLAPHRPSPGRAGRRRAWGVIVLLVSIDALLVGILAPAAGDAVGPPHTGAAPRSERASRRALNPDFQSEVQHALLYRSDGPGSRSFAPVCRQDEPTYGQIDTCGT
jgi:hypothetical protein